LNTELSEEDQTGDAASRLGNVNTKGQQIELHEFDHKGGYQVIYQENGVTIRTIPAIHECFLPPELLVEKPKFLVEDALNVGTQVHTSPVAARSSRT
jgi:ribonuclease Z